jgi:hypothetical protein
LGAEDESAINFNGDGGDIGPGDYGVWKSHFGESNVQQGGGGANVPEPNALAILSVVIGVSIAVRRRGDRSHRAGLVTT